VLEPLVANDLLADAGALRQRMDQEGYLFFRGIIAPEVLIALRDQIVTIWCDEEATDPASTYPRLFGLEALHRFFHGPPMTDIARELIGEPVVPHVHKQVRIQAPAWPGAVPGVSATHQDFVYNQGTTQVYTCWVPLGDLPAGRGGLEVLRGGHTRGIYRAQAPTTGSITVSIAEVEQADAWVSPDYHLGDATFFHSLTPHRAPANRTAALRISVDCRYQAISQPFAEPLLRPLPGVEAAYPTWQSQDLAYYWKKLDLKVIGYDTSYFEAAGVAPPVSVSRPRDERAEP
jgi:hypothetical protein